MLNVVKAWLRHQLNDYDLIAKGEVGKFALRLSLKGILVANIINFIFHVVLSCVGLLPYPLMMALGVGLSITTLITFAITFMFASAIGKAICELSVSRDAFARLSLTDPLSGLLNRRAFFDVVGRYETDAVFVLFDIDRFKAVNDTYGHIVGDEVIQGVARVLLGVFTGDGAAVARLGGEEFSIVVRKNSDDQHMRLIETARVSISEFKFGTDSNHVTVSAGVAYIFSDREIEKTYKLADSALYTAKSSGRNCIVYEDDIAMRKQASSQGLMPPQCDVVHRAVHP